MKNKTPVKTPLKRPYTPWNKGRSVGQMKPFTPGEVRTIKDILKRKEALRDMALFSMAIDTMLRSSDLLSLKVSDVKQRDGSIRTEIQIRQQKTGQGTLVALTPKTREVVKHWIEASNKYLTDPLFTGLTEKTRYEPITHRQYTRLVKRWATYAGLDPKHYSTHSLRRTKAALIYEKTQNVEIVRQLLGQKSVTATSFYLNISKRQALDVALEVEI